MALESVRLRRSRNANGISEERREEFRNLTPASAPRHGQKEGGLKGGRGGVKY